MKNVNIDKLKNRKDYIAEIDKHVDAIIEYSEKAGNYTTNRTIMTSILFGVSMGMIHMLAIQKNVEGYNAPEEMDRAWKKIEERLGL